MNQTINSLIPKKHIVFSTTIQILYIYYLSILLMFY